MVLTVILSAVLGYFALALPVAVVLGRSLRTPVEPYLAEPAVTRAAALPRRRVVRSARPASSRR